MHELRIAEDLVRIVLEAARENKLTRVSSVNVSFGRMVSIVPEIFEYAFREAVRETPASDAGISIEILPLKLKCNICGREHIINRHDFKCDNCGSYEQDVIEGNNMFIKSIEGEQ